MRRKPSPSVSTLFIRGPDLGALIPVDPFYLTWKAREYEFPTRFIELAGETNTAMPEHVVNQVSAALGQRGKTLKGSRVLVLGAAYKEGHRRCPGVALIEDYGVARHARRPRYLPRSICASPRQDAEIRFSLESIPLTAEALREHDCALIVTDHTAVDYELVVSESSLVVDTRNATARVKSHREKIVRC